MLYFFVVLVSIFLLIFFDYKINKKIDTRKNFWFRILFIILICIAGLRYYIGIDTENYFRYFSEIPILDDISSQYLYESRFQPGFNIFMSTSKTIYPSFTFFLTIHALILNIIISKFIKENSKYIFSTVLFYLILSYLEFDTEIMRESLAVAFSLMFIKYWKLKRRVVSLFFICLAFSFHISSFVALLYLLADHVKFTKKKLILVIILTIIIPVVFRSIPNLGMILSMFTSQEALIDRYNHQTLSSNLNIFFFVGTFVKYIVFPVCGMLFIQRYKNLNYCGYIFLYMILQILGSYSYAFYRFANYFVPFMWIMLADFSALFIMNWIKNMRLIVVIVIVVSILFIYQSHMFDKDSCGNIKYSRYFPYQTVINPQNTYMK